MRIRRCAIVFVEPRERLEFDLVKLLQGSSGVAPVREWIGLAAHRDEEIPLNIAEITLLGQLPIADWIEHDSFDDTTCSTAFQSLIEKGLLITDTPDGADMRARDDALRASHWRGLAATAQRHLRWHGIDTLQAENNFARTSDRSLLEHLGEPEPPVRERVEPSQRIALAPVGDSELERLIKLRVTCRNFDRARAMSLEDFTTVLFRTFAARAVSDQPGIDVIKRAVPSAGGLHPTEAYLLVQNVDGVKPGFYHYHPVDHALEPLQELSADDNAATALRIVAGQQHFKDAHVIIILASRFRRTFWKYRNHAKAYRAVILDAGHLSQTLYLAATERGLAAFITAAVNEIDIESLFGLDPMQEGVLAVCGFGWRGDTIDEVEFDPLGSVWPVETRKSLHETEA